MLVEAKETNAQYHADTSRCSNSMLSLLKRSPRLFDQVYNLGTAKIQRTKQMILGDWVHCRTLEPQEYLTRYPIAPKVDKRTNAGKAAWNEFVESCVPGAEPITIEDSMLVTAMASALRSHDTLAPFLAPANLGSSLIEQRINFEFNGLPCRCKPDLQSINARVIFDIKTAQDATPEGFAKSVCKFGYHRQAAFYLEGARQEHKQEFRFLFGVVSSKEPHECAVYELDPEWISLGLDELFKLTEQLKIRRRRNDWRSAWETGIVPLDKQRFYNPTIYEVDDSSDESEGEI